MTNDEWNGRATVYRPHPGYGGKTIVADAVDLCPDCTTGIAEVVSGKRKWGEKKDDRE